MDGIRRTLALTVAATLVIGFAFLLLQASTPTAKAGEAGLTRLGWLGGCYPPALAVGRYFPGDAPCQPRETISLTRLAADLAARGVLRPGERLDYAPQPRARALTCWGLIMRGPQAAGWICSDESGVYRVGMEGQPMSERWQLTAEGNWVES